MESSKPAYYLVSVPGDRHEDMSPQGLFSNMNKVFHFIKTRIEQDISCDEYYLHVMRLNQIWHGKYCYSDYDYVIFMVKSDDGYRLYINCNQYYTLDKLPKHLESTVTSAEITYDM